MQKTSTCCKYTYNYYIQWREVSDPDCKLTPKSRQEDTNHYEHTTQLNHYFPGIDSAEKKPVRGHVQRAPCMIRTRSLQHLSTGCQM